MLYGLKYALIYIGTLAKFKFFVFLIIVSWNSTTINYLRAQTLQNQSGRNSNLQIFSNLEFRRIQNKSLNLDLYVLQTNEIQPLIVWIHGGAWKKGNKKNIPPLPLLTENGFIVASITYRSSTEAIFPAQIQDCKAAIRWLRAHSKDYNINPHKIGVWGISSGGHLASLLGTTGDVKEFEDGNYLEYSSKVQAVCNWYGPTDFLQMDSHAHPDSLIVHDAKDSPESCLIGGPVQKNKERAKIANPITYISKNDAPFLVMHGDHDRSVPIHQSEILYNALLENGIKVSFHRIEDGRHGGKKFHTSKIKKIIIDFFKNHLMN